MLAYNHSSSEESQTWKPKLKEILLKSFRGEYDKEEIEAFGKEVAGSHFQVISREGIEKPHNYQGEIFTLLRLTEFPVQDLTELLVTDYLGYQKGSPEYNVAMKLAEKAALENNNPYHNVRHICNYIAGIALAEKEGLSRKSKYRLIVGGLFHDIGHDGIFGKLEKIYFGKSLEKQRLEKKALEMVGLTKEDGKIHVAEGSPFKELLESGNFSEKDIVQIFGNIIATAFPDKAEEARKAYFEARKSGKPIPPEVAERYLAVCMDMWETMTLAGYSVTTGALIDEELHALETCWKDGKFEGQEEEYNVQLERIQTMGTLEDVAGFRRFVRKMDQKLQHIPGLHYIVEGVRKLKNVAGLRQIADFFFKKEQCALGEKELGILGEVTKVIVDAEAGKSHSVFQSRAFVQEGTKGVFQQKSMLIRDPVHGPSRPPQRR